MTGTVPTRAPGDTYTNGPSYRQLVDAMIQVPPATISITVGGHIIEILPCDFHVLGLNSYCFGGEYIGSPQVTALHHYVECTTSFERTPAEGKDAPSKGTYFPKPRCVRHTHRREMADA